jgi:HPt (histidine-containing phosphotransfer) domain-containing protein
VTEDRAPAVDSAALDRLAEELDDVHEIVQLYLRALPLRCGSIAQALAAGDAGALRDAAHTLRSASAFVGAAGLAALCDRLEQVSTQAAPLPVALGMEVAAEGRRVEAELIALLARPPFS